MIGKPPDDRTQVEVTVGNMYRQHAVRFQLVEVDRESFLRQEMYRDGVTAECVDCQDIQVLSLVISDLLLHREPRVARNDVDLRGRIMKKGEIALRVGSDCDNCR